MSNYGPRMPLHQQSPDVAKAAREGSPSWESFRPNVVHPSGNYNPGMPDNRATVEEQYRMRRYPNGELAYDWAAQQLIDAVHAVQSPQAGDPNTGSQSLTPIQVALLTIVFPAKYRKMEPMQAEIMTKLSQTERERLAVIVLKQLQDERAWNAGQGGGTVEGAYPRNTEG